MAFNTNLQLVMNYLKQGKHAILPAQNAGVVVPYPGAPNPNLDLANQAAKLIGSLNGVGAPTGPKPVPDPIQPLQIKPMGGQ